MHSTSLSFECTAIVWEMQEGIAITNNYANIWPRGAEGVKNWPGRRNRLPHPVCKPLDSKEGGADGFACRAAPGLLTYDFWERASFPFVIHYGQYKQYVLPNFELRSQMSVQSSCETSALGLLVFPMALQFIYRCQKERRVGLAETRGPIA